jgi:hypothetical protein
MDTADENGFLDRMITPEDQHYVEVAPRSIRILRAFYDPEHLRAEKVQERLGKLPPADYLKKEIRRAAVPSASENKTGKKGRLHGAYMKHCKRCAGKSLPPRYRR